MITPRRPVEESPEDDPTGVRALLASLPEPEPMPAYLVERISASLAAEQASRARAITGATVVPLARRRPVRKVVLGLAGVAAAAAVVGLVGTGLLRGAGQASSGAAASMATTQRTTPSAAAPVSPSGRNGTHGLAATPPMRIQLSATRYTRGAFVAQAGALASATPASPVQPLTAQSPEIGPLATPVGLADCLRALGVGQVDAVTADLGFYEGTPAAVIVTVTGPTRTAYAVRRSCSADGAAVLHPGVPVS